MDLGSRHFSEIFKDDNQTNIGDQLKVIQNFPSFVVEYESDTFTSKITLGEIEGALRSFKKDRSPGPDGWPVEFFLYFLDLLGSELLDAVESSRVLGRVEASLKSTFINLIPKKEGSLDPNQFQSISLCNVIYQIITKVVENILKGLLPALISEEQTGYVEGIQILDGILLDHEAIHTLKYENKPGFLIKLDISKVVDKISC